MITVRKSEERGHFKKDGLETYHTFSFAEYYDEKHMNFRALRVINEDRLKPGTGFSPHTHRDMEIITYVLEGEIEHKDNLGNDFIVHAGDVQRMTAGTGITHSEYNPSQTDMSHLFQIWIFPEKKGLKPEYEQKHFSDEVKKPYLIVSKDGRDNSISINQDANIYTIVLDAGETLTFQQNPDRYAWVQLIYGNMTINGTILKQGDGATVENEASLDLKAADSSKLLLFDLA